MIWLLAVLVLSGISAQGQTITETFGSGANQFSIDFVQIGNPGNAADTTGSPNPVGSVGYVFNLGKYEISRDIIDKANSLGGLGVSMYDMTSYGGNGANRPATGVSWNEAARFVNWLNTSRGYQAAYRFITSGQNDNISLWDEGVASNQGNRGLLNRFRHKDAYYFLPSIDEWYKAAYGAPTGEWFNYPTGGDAIPEQTRGGTAQGTAVFGFSQESGPADIMDAGGLSKYGTMAQGGNALEWMENTLYGNNSSVVAVREARGGNWYNGTATDYYGTGDGLINMRTYSFDPDWENVLAAGGFRVASVPEPSSLSLLLAGGAVLMAGRRRFLKIKNSKKGWG